MGNPLGSQRSDFPRYSFLLPGLSGLLVGHPFDTVKVGPARVLHTLSFIGALSLQLYVVDDSETQLLQQAVGRPRLEMSV